MTGAGRKRQQRVRHEAGGSTGTGDNVSTEQPPASVPVSATDTVPARRSTAASGNQASSSAASVAASKPSRGGRGGRGGGRRGVATVDQTQHYQPVTIMESANKGDSAANELDDEPRQKYKRRGIVSNWSRYEERSETLEQLDDGSDYLIGEDFSTVLQQQKQGRGGAGHLLLREEQGWGVDRDGWCSGEYGLGALKVDDLTATMATISLMDQLGIDSSLLPKQLAEEYQNLADDNRRLYDPAARPAAVVDAAEIIEQQMEDLRLSFFGTSRNKLSSNASVKKPVVQPKSNNAKDNDRINLEDLEDPFMSTIDFNAPLDDANNGDKTLDAKVDLTEKMCLAFGSNINEIGDDFGGLVLNNDDENDAPTHERNTDNSSAPANIDINISDNSSDKRTEPNIATEPEIDFSLGSNTTFNFGLPKIINNIDASSKVTPVTKPCPVTDPIIPEAVPEVAPVEEEKILGPALVDLDAPIIPQPVKLKALVEDTKELEDWLDSVLDD